MPTPFHNTIALKRRIERDILAPDVERILKAARMRALCEAEGDEVEAARYRNEENKALAEYIEGK